jgi:ATP-binding cassette subfamily B protein
MGVLWRLTALAWQRYRSRILLAYLCLLASTGFSLLIPRLLGSAVDQALGAGELSRLVLLALAILGASALRGLFGYGEGYLGEWISQRAAYDLRNALFDKLQQLSFGYHDRQQTGNLMSKATSDVEGVRWYIQQGLLRAIQLVALIAGTVVLLLVINWQLALLCLALLPLIIWRAVVVTWALRAIWRRIQDTTGGLTTVLQENLTGVRVVKAFGAEEFEEAKFGRRAQEVAGYNVTASRVQAANSSQMTLAFAVATGLVLWFGGRQVLSGSLTPGELAQFIFYLGLITHPIRRLGFILNSFSRGISSGQRIYDVLDAHSPVEDRPGARALGRVRGHVRFEDVAFSYDNLAPVLQGVSLEARPGQMVALVGAPGSGKSTIAHLVPRFYDVTSGRVTVDGVDLRDVTLASLRRNVGVVMQDVFLFSATVRENIAYGMPEASLEKVTEAAKAAQLHDFIVRLPRGYDTWVGERGVTLSGGQRQRLAIARTLLLDPPVLILDDSTSSVDARTEELIHRTLNSLMKGRTTFVIAHRVSTLQNADLILVLKNGQVVERGTHEELRARGGLYQEIYDLQLGTQEAATPSSGDGHDGREALSSRESSWARRRGGS